jgi:hypothetical protein
MPPACLEQFTVHHDNSPLAAMRRHGLSAPDFPTSFRATPINPGTAQPLGPFHGLLWIVNGEAVLDASLLGDVQVIDSTRLAPGERLPLGQLGPTGRTVPPRVMARMLLEASLVRTYAHLESTVCLERETPAKDAWEGHYSGEHVFYTSKRNTARFAFTLRIETAGAITVAG